VSAYTDALDVVINDRADRERRRMDLWQQHMATLNDDTADEAAKAEATAWLKSSEANLGGLAEMKQREGDFADSLIHVAIEHHAMRYTMTAEQFHTLTMWTGRVYGPRSLQALDLTRSLRPDAYADIVGYAWGLAEFPSLSIPRREWVALFRKAGYTFNGETDVARPTEPLTLWRGAWAKYKNGLAWSDNRKVAEHFAKVRSGDGRVWTATVAPDRLLAYIHDDGRGEEEWIVNTIGLRIKEAS